MERGKQSKVMKVLMLPWLAHGHISPFMELAKRLASRDFHIYICSTPVNLKSIQKKITERFSSSLNGLSSIFHPPLSFLLSATPPMACRPISWSRSKKPTKNRLISSLISYSPCVLTWLFMILINLGQRKSLHLRTTRQFSSSRLAQRFCLLFCTWYMILEKNSHIQKFIWGSPGESSWGWI